MFFYLFIKKIPNVDFFRNEKNVSKSGSTSCQFDGNLFSVTRLEKFLQFKLLG